MLHTEFEWIKEIIWQEFTKIDIWITDLSKKISAKRLTAGIVRKNGELFNIDEIVGKVYTPCYLNWNGRIQNNFIVWEGRNPRPITKTYLGSFLIGAVNTELPNDRTILMSLGMKLCLA